MTNWEDLVEDEELDKVSKYRNRTYEKETVKKEMVESYENDGWIKHHTNKSGSVEMRKPKKLVMPLKMKFGLFFLRWDSRK